MVKQRGKKKGVILTDQDYPKLIHIIVISIAIVRFLRRLHISEITKL